MEKKPYDKQNDVKLHRVIHILCEKSTVKSRLNEGAYSLNYEFSSNQGTLDFISGKIIMYRNHPVHPVFKPH